MTQVYQPALLIWANLGDVANVATARTNLGVGADSLAVHLAGSETITGKKQFAGALDITGGFTGSASELSQNANFSFIYTGRNSNATGNFLVQKADGTELLKVLNDNTLTIGAFGVAVTRGATETITGPKIFAPGATFGIGNAASNDVYVNISAGDNYASYIMFQANGGQRWAVGRPGTTNNWAAYSYGVGGYAIYANYSTGIVDFNYGTTVAGKAVLSHAGAYTSGKVTMSTSAPSGGSDGDIWYQYI